MAVLHHLVAAAAFALTVGVVEFVLRLHLADQHPGLGLDHEVRLVGFAGAVVDAELIAAGLEPFLDAGVAVDGDGESPLGVGVELLERIAALLEAAEDMLARIGQRRDGLLEIADALALRARSSAALAAA